MNDRCVVLPGDCRTLMPLLPDDCVHCCITSPPYLGLRDYGMEAQIGLTDNLAAYIESLVTVFRAVRRVLRPNGTLWLNLGDSFAQNRGRQVPDGKHRDVGNSRGSKVPEGLKPKDLIGVPWRVAFALQEDGWYLRSDIIWAKGNPMPESVTDRPTRAHEYLFLFTKEPHYYYDATAVREPAVSVGRSSGNKERKVATGGERSRLNTHMGSSIPWMDDGKGRNRRSVWNINTQPYKGAHFAVFPPALVEPCLLAGCPPDGIALDPFAGSGTVGQVALQHGRRALLMELNPDYCTLIHNRLRGLDV